jgi:cytochrome c oxidase subunit 3
MVELRPEPQFASLAQQTETAQLGMWVSLATEVLFFGALIFAYYIYRISYPDQFVSAGSDAKLLLGSINTAILLTSSVTMVAAIEYVKRDEISPAVTALFITALLGFAFLGVKGYEYFEDYRDHTVPLLSFLLKPTQHPPAELFWMFYFVATGIHAVHLSIGIAAVLLMAFHTRRGRYSAAYYSPLEVLAFIGASLIRCGSFFSPRSIRSAGRASGRGGELLPYLVTWLILLVLLGVSVLTAYLPLGNLHPLANFGIAVVQAAIVFAIFMRLRDPPAIKWVFAGAGFF